jgi:uncharacterized protein
MELSSEFFVKADPDEAWKVLTDFERVAGCVPGAELREVDGDEYRGVLHVTVGQVSTEYRGSARLIEVDERSRRAVLHVEGREVRGKGTAEMTVTAALAAEGAGTKVSVATELTVSGRIGRLSQAEVATASTELIEHFAGNLAALVAPARRRTRTAPAATGAKAAAPADKRGKNGAADKAEPTANGEPAGKGAEPAGKASKAAEQSTTRRGSQPASESRNGHSTTAAHSASHNGAGSRSDQSAAGNGSGTGKVSGNGAGTESESEVALEIEEVDEADGGSWLPRIAAVLVVALALALLAAWLQRRRQ